VQRLSELFDEDARVACGLMSGTSLDGVDAAVARVSGSGRSLECEPLGFVSRPYPEALKEALLDNSAPESSSVRALSQLNVRVAHVYAEAVRAAAEEAGLPGGPDGLDLIGSHGQTVQHVPDPEDWAGQDVRSSLQIGDPSVLANLTGVPTVGDFRLADMACGGQGAPLVPYFDYVLFASGEETRGMLNLGGIANLTVLPVGAPASAAYAFDTGPADMVIDTLMDRLFDAPYDEDGRLAAEGTVQRDLLDDIVSEDDYFDRPPPKSTGRERYGAAYAEALLRRGQDLSARDLVATATALTARSVHLAYEQFIEERHPFDTLVVSGGGVWNRALMVMLREEFAGVEVRTSSHHGIDSDAKEALCWAVFAHETINGQPVNLPAVTGAERATLLGKVCVPAQRVRGHGSAGVRA
jgi:anhydro-N-acetylmuramic acid kinase